MSDTATGGAQGAGTGTGQSQAGTSQGDAQQAGNSGAGDQGKPAAGTGQGSSQTPEQLQEAIRVREAENATYREKIRLYEEAETKRQQDAMTDEQRRAAETKAIEDERDKLKSQLADRDDRDAVVAKAQALGFKNPELGAGLVTLSEVRGTDGKLDAAAVEAKLRERLTADPYLGNGGTGDGAGGRGGQTGNGADMNALIRGGRK